jgi:Nuclease-related domain
MENTLDQMSIALGLALFIGVLYFIATGSRRQYEQSTYYRITKNQYFTTTHNSGLRGEYRIYTTLQHLERAGGKFLFNLYIPKSKDETTEIDVILISAKGIFVFESKNFSGWIFGNEAHKNWMQVLPHWSRHTSTNTQFYNPIMQNAAHIRYLKRLIPKNIPITSVIVFSDHCALKKVTINSQNVYVTQVRALSSVMERIWNIPAVIHIPQDQINRLEGVLYPYTQVDSAIKRVHNETLRSKNYDGS